LTHAPGRAVRVYVTTVDDAGAPARLDHYLALLGEGERARHASLQHDASRRQFLIGRALVRHALSCCAPVAPDKWRLAAAEGGRPEVDRPRLRPRPRFSLAHTAEVVACAVVEEVDVGLDIERLDARGDGAALARQLFAPAEAAALASLAPPERRQRFAEYWTLKEAYLKACGRGLSVPLDAFWFLLAPGAPIRIRFKRELRDRPGRWRFTSRRTLRDHVLSVALAAGLRAPEIPVSVEWCVPLVSS
jgi:4'-phosphopantetheinyl transferase